MQQRNMLLITHNSPTLVDCQTGCSCLCRCPRNNNKKNQHVLLVPLDLLWFWRLNGLSHQDETMIPTHIDDLYRRTILFLQLVWQLFPRRWRRSMWGPPIGRRSCRSGWAGRHRAWEGFFFLSCSAQHSLQEPNSKRAPGQVEASAP